MINKIILLGNVGADPEIRTLDSGVKTARIRLATTENIYDKKAEKWESRTEWHTLTLWRNFAETADKYIRKGSQIYAEGVLHYRTYKDKNGVEKTAAEITATELKVLQRGGDKSQSITETYINPGQPSPQPSLPSVAPQVAPTPNLAPPEDGVIYHSNNENN